MSGQAFDEEFDFVVVGSGGGSMCAGLVMRSVGKSVVVLEKAPLIGGTTSRSGGVMWIPNNPFMAQDGVADSYEEAMKYMEATAGQSVDAPGTTRERRSAYVTEGPKMIAFLLKQGIKLMRPPWWPDYYDDRAGGSKKGRTVIADLFDTNELGEWRDKLEPNFLPMPMYHSEGFDIALQKSSWRGKVAMMKVGLRVVLSKLKGQRLTTAGGALQGRMMQASLKAGVDLRVNSAVTGFLMQDGACKGVTVQRDGREVRIGARNGVLVNAGGFSHNQAMRDKYQPGTSSKWSAATGGSTGEMILAMEELGGQLAQMEEMVGNQMTVPPGGENPPGGPGIALGALAGGQMNYSKPHSIVVDQSGQRYMNECGSYMEFCQNLLKRNQTVPALPSWWIVDGRYPEKYMYGGKMAGATPSPEWVENGFLKQADTVEGLAGQLGIEPAVLRATVDRFNEHARKGVDEDFGRGNRDYDNWLGDFYRTDGSHTLGTLEQGPFRALPVVPGDVGTFGGVVTDVNARVLRADGSVIEGLYATGISTASVMGRYYPGAGSSVGPSFVWGYIAAKHAANAGNVA
ncbi:MAG: FAD-binding protein [Sphingomonadales bacterium]|nr:FAD-binding protein [Sphingomonadales bacterium]